MRSRALRSHLGVHDKRQGLSASAGRLLCAPQRASCGASSHSVSHSEETNPASLVEHRLPGSLAIAVLGSRVLSKRAWGIPASNRRISVAALIAVRASGCLCLGSARAA